MSYSPKTHLNGYFDEDELKMILMVANNALASNRPGLSASFHVDEQHLLELQDEITLALELTTTNP